jgi:hypothetical protein
LANKLLENGALCIDVTIQVKQKKQDMYQPPSNSKKMLKLLKSAEDADVLSTVGAKIFLAHKAIMKDSLPILVDYCKCIKDPVGNNESIAARAIEGLSPKAFQLILEHIHAGSYPTDKDAIKCGKELIDAPNKFYLVELKMTVENILVQECVVMKENVSEYIVFADSK